MSLLDYFSPQTSTPQRSTSKGSGPSAEGGASNTAVAAQQSSGGGIMGMFHSVGSWMADTWHDTTTAVGNAVDRVGTVAKDVWDVAKSTSLGWQDGQLTVDTDLDEVMDLMPQKARDALQLDRNASQNRVKLQFDHKSGTLTASSDDLALASVNTEKVQTGKVHLRGAKLTLANPGGGVPFMDGDFSALGYHDKDDNLQASLSMEGMEAENINIQGKDGPVRIAGVQTGALSAHASSERGMPFADKGNTSAGFSVEKAVIRGVAGAGVSADEVHADRLDAGISEGAETAFLETQGLGLKGAKQGDLSLGDASVAQARIDVHNKGGGAVFLDDSQDHIAADIAVSAAGISDFKRPDSTVGAASLARFRALYNQDAGTLSADVDDVKASKVGAANVGVDDLDLDGVHVDMGPGRDGPSQDKGTTLNVAADAAHIKGVNVDTTAKNAAPAAPSTGPTSPLHWTAGLGALDVDGLRAGDAWMGAAAAQNLKASGDLTDKGATFQAGLSSAAATDVHYGDLSAGEISVRDASGSRGTDGLTHIGAKGTSIDALTARNFSAAHLRADGAEATLNGQDADATLSHARVDQARIGDRLDVNLATVENAALGLHGDRRTVSLGAAHAEGLRDAVTDSSLASADLNTLKFANEAGKIDASLASASVRGAHIAGRADLDAARLQNLSVGLDGEDKRATLGSLHAEGIRDAVTHSSLASADLSDLSASEKDGVRKAHFGEAGFDDLRVQAQGTTSSIAKLRALDGTLSQDALGTHATLATAAATDVHHGEISMEQLATRNASVDIGDKNTLIGADGVQVDALSAPNFEAKRLAAEGARVRLAGDDATAHLDHAAVDEAKVADRLLIGRATAEGVDANQRGDRRGVTVDAAHVADVKDSPTGTTLATGDLAGLRFARDTAGIDAGLDQLSLNQVHAAQGDLGRLDLRGATLNQTDAATTARLASANASDLSLHTPGTDASLKALSAESASVRLDSKGTDASVGHLAATDARFSHSLATDGKTATPAGPAAPAGPGVDMGTLVRTLSARVDDADISAHAPLNAGDYKSLHLGVERGTELDASVSIRDGAFDRNGTKASFNHELDAPLWVGVAGAYLNDKNELMADVRGWKDQNISEKVNESLGLRGKSMPTVATLGDAVADKLDAPAAPTTGKPAKKESGPGAGDLVNLDGLSANARVSLNAGTIDAGPAGSLTLAPGQKAGDNTLLAQATGRDRIVASFSDLLSSAFNLNAAGNQIQGGPAELQDARVRADLQGSDARIDGSLGQADLRDLRVVAPTTIPTAEQKKKAAGVS